MVGCKAHTTMKNEAYVLYAAAKRHAVRFKSNELIKGFRFLLILTSFFIYIAHRQSPAAIDISIPGAPF